MEKEFKIVGKNLTSEKKSEFVRKKDEIERESRKPFENELEKTDKAKEIIGFINVCLLEEFTKLGLKYTDIPFEKVHIFSKNGFAKTFPNESETVRGFNSSVGREAYIKTCEEIAGTFKTIVHEMVHLASYHAYYGDVKNNELKNYRSGYYNINWEKNHQHFKGLNEGIIDLLVSEIVNKKHKEISDILGISKDDWRNVRWYWEESELVDAIIDKISKVENEEWDNVYSRFKEGLFSGKMMHLRDIEKSFGKDSLRILSYWEPTTDDADENKKDMYRKIYKFFKADNESEREKIRKELL